MSIPDLSPCPADTYLRESSSLKPVPFRLEEEFQFSVNVNNVCVGQGVNFCGGCGTAPILVIPAIQITPSCGVSRISNRGFPGLKRHSSFRPFRFNSAAQLRQKQSSNFRTCENTAPVTRLNFLHINIMSERFPEAYISFFDSYKDAQRNLLASILLIQLAKSQCTERFGMAMSLCNDLTSEPNYNRPPYSHSAHSYSN